MESDNRRLLSSRFPGIPPASRLLGSSIGNLGQFPGKLAPREGEIAGFELPPTSLIIFYTRNQPIQPMASSSFLLIGYDYN